MLSGGPNQTEEKAAPTVCVLGSLHAIVERTELCRDAPQQGLVYACTGSHQYARHVDMTGKNRADQRGPLASIHTLQCGAGPNQREDNSIMTASSGKMQRCIAPPAAAINVGACCEGAN